MKPPPSNRALELLPAKGCLQKTLPSGHSNLELRPVGTVLLCEYSSHSPTTGFGAGIIEAESNFDCEILLNVIARSAIRLGKIMLLPLPFAFKD